MLSVQKAIDQLATIKARKGMYFRPRIEEAQTFLDGFRLALIAAGFSVTYQSGRAVLQRRGWEVTSAGVSPSMRSSGLTDEQMIDELIEAFAEELRQIPNPVCSTTGTPACASEDWADAARLQTLTPENLIC